MQKNIMLNIKDIAEKSKLTESHIRQLLREGKLNGKKVGKEWRVSSEELNSYLGIKTDMYSLQRDLYIKDLESKVKNYELQMNTLKNLVNTLDEIIQV